MRVSGIESYLGGADNVNALSVLHGEQLNFSGTVQDENSMAMDITDFTITAVAEFYRATVSITGSGSRATAAVSALEPALQNADNTMAVADYTFDTNDIEITDAATGRFRVTIPADIVAADEVQGADATTNILTAVIYLTYNDGAASPTIRKSRVLVFFRHAG